MKLNVYSIFDGAAQFYGRPFFLLNDQIAKRTALDIRLDSGTEISKHPEDFTMFYLGTFDDSTCVFESLPTPRRFLQFHEIQLPLDV